MEQKKLKCLGKDLGTLSRDDEGIFQFRYSPGWLADGFPLSPDLPLCEETFQRSGDLWGPFADASPEGWGQRVLQVAEYYAALFENRPPKFLDAYDIFVRSDNFSRQGAIEAHSTHKNFYKDPTTDPKYWEQIARFEDREKSDPDVVLGLLRRGISSGGARPKTSIVVDGELWLAKAKSSEDNFLTVPLWESVNLSLARRCGLDVPETRYDAKNQILLTKRFDRNGAQKRHYASARTLLGLRRDDVVSYADLANRLEMSEKEKMELFGRLVLDICVLNLDDHLCNMGFLYNGNRFRLSPLFDVQTFIERSSIPLHHMEVCKGSQVSTLDNALQSAGEMGLEQDWAVARIREINGTVLRHWEEEAKAHSASEAEMSSMQQVYRRFEGADLAPSMSFRP